MVINLVSSCILPEDRPELPEEPAPGICCLTGDEGETIARKLLITPSFTDCDLLKRPDSDRVGVAAWTALRFRPERMSSWFCAHGEPFRKLDRFAVREMVLAGDPDAGSWAAYATTSYKKHGAMRAPLNTGGLINWRFENVTVDCSDRTRLLGWWAVLNGYLRAGISRKAMEIGRANSFAFRAAGVPLCLEFEEWARDKYRAPLYKFLCYLLPSQKELKEE